MNNISIHFTIKDQPLSDIEEKFDSWLRDNIDDVDANVVINHCFLPREVVEEKGFPTDLLDFIESIGFKENTICWYNDALLNARRDMLQALKSIGGTALFIGDVKEGVQVELDLAKELGVNYICI